MKKWLIGLFSFVLIACSAEIVPYINPDAEYKSFESYWIVNPKVDKNQIGGQMELIYKDIQESIKKEMSQKSYKESTVSPDLILRYELITATRVGTTIQQSVYSPDYYIDSRIVQEATILLQLFDQKKKLVWQCSHDLKQETKKNDLNQIIGNTIAKMFTTYPYQAHDDNPNPTFISGKKKKSKI